MLTRKFHINALLIAVILAIGGCGGSGSGASEPERGSDEIIDNQDQSENENTPSLPDTSDSESLIGNYLTVTFATSISTLNNEEEGAVRQAGCIRCGTANIARIDLYKDKVESYIALNEFFIKETVGVYATNSDVLVSQLAEAETLWTELFLTKVSSLYESRDPTWPSRLINDLNDNVRELFEALRLRLAAIAVVKINTD